MKTKKVNRIKMGIVAVALVAMIMLSVATATAADRGSVSRCPSDNGAVDSTPGRTIVEYTQSIQGTGYEQINTQTSTGGMIAGIGSSLYSRGTGSVVSSRIMTVDTSGLSSINQNYAYVGGFEGETGVQSYLTGVVVRDRYSNVYSRSADQVFAGNNMQTEYSASTETYGQTKFKMRVVNPENYHHTIMRMDEQHVGDFTTDRAIRVGVTPATPAPAPAPENGRSVCSGRSP